MKFALFGAGRVGRNIAVWLGGLGHAVSVISHEMADNDREGSIAAVDEANIVLVAIPDSALHKWLSGWAKVLDGKLAVHFSGALTIPGMHSFHPLFSFPNTALSGDVMKRIAFACPEAGPDFSEVFPGATNPHFIVGDADRARYHALCVLSGNLAAFLWNETAREFAASFEAPPETLNVYFQSLVDRFSESPMGSLTGPVARRDRVSVEANLKALEETPRLHALYHAFLNAAWPDFNAMQR